MNYLLCLLLGMILVLNLLLEKKILFPGTIVSGVFLYSAILVCINSKLLIRPINFNSVIFIAVSIFLFSVGTQLGQRLTLKKRRKDKIINLEFSDIPKRLLLLGILFDFIIVVIYFLHQFILARALGAGSLLMMFSVLRSNLKLKPDMYALSIPLNISLAFVRAFGYCCLYLFLKKIIIKKRKEAIKYLLPITILLISELLSSSRIGLIAFASATLFNIYSVGIQYGMFNNKNVIKIGIKLFAITFIGFYLFGNLSGQSLIYSAWETLFLYSGASIICLDYFIIHKSLTPIVFGQYSFKGINSLLRRLGFSISTYSNHLPNVYFGNHGTNIYTALFPFAHDFGLSISFIFQLTIGIIFGMAWKRYNKSFNNNSLITIVYGRFFGYALFMYSIAERLLSEFLALNVFIELGFYWLLIKFVLSKRVSSNK